MFPLISGGHLCTKTVHQYGVSIQCSTKVQETCRPITQKLSATKTGQIVGILVFYNISFSCLLPPDGFQFFGCVTVKTIYTVFISDLSSACMVLVIERKII